MEQPTRRVDRLHDGCSCSVNNSSWGTGSVASNGGLSGMSHGRFSACPSAEHDRYRSRARKTWANDEHIGVEGVGKPFHRHRFHRLRANLEGVNMSGPTGASSGSADQGSHTTTSLTMLTTPRSSST